MSAGNCSDRGSDLARRLDAADRDRRPLPRTAGFDGDLTAAYRVQEEFVARRSARRGSPPAAHKVALTSAAAQAALGADEPAAGVLLAADVRASGARVPPSDVFAPLLEVELVFRLDRDLPAGAGLAEVLAASHVAAGLECPDGRHDGWFGGDFPALPLPAVVADDCLAGLLVVGPVWRPAAALDLRAITATLRTGGEVVAEGSATAVLDHPGSAVVWLNDHLTGRGTGLRAGALVSSGTLTPPVPFRPGTARAEVSHGLGPVEALLG